MSRHRIEGLVNFNLRILQTQMDALDTFVERERLRRGDPGVTRTTIIREAVSAYIKAPAIVE